MRVDDINGMIETLRKWTDEAPHALSFLSRLIPVTDTFSFQSPGEFEEKAKEIVLAWVPELAGKSFHVRMRRRGFKGRLSGLEEEHFLDKVLIEALEKTGNPGHITFENPDAISQ
jgi:tRNA(Ser,Leu) C12 N-acetylase TAN1